jgi:hypothetical protein
MPKVPVRLRVSKGRDGSNMKQGNKKNTLTLNRAIARCDAAQAVIGVRQNRTTGDTTSR